MLWFSIFLFYQSSASFAMDQLSDASLTEVTGQAGADLALKLTLNQDGSGAFDQTLCADLRYCRLGIALNNRYHDGTQDSIDATTGVITPSSTGRKQWLVFKGIQGMINIKEMKLDGEDVTWGSTTKAAIKLSFDKTKPIEIRNLGFQSLAIETDTVANEGSNNIAGYLDNTKYTASTTTFDGNNPVTGQARERGFLGLNMNTNLAITGSIKMFSCGNGHPRCS